MRRLLLALLFVTIAAQAGATPVIAGLEPQEGFTFGPTHVTIVGLGFADGAVEVFFDDVKAQVLAVTPTTIRVLAAPTANGSVRESGTADVTVRVAGHGETTAPNIFLFDALAQPGPEDYAPVLVPLTARTLKGAHGSLWSTELRIFNSSHLVVRMPGPEEIFRELPIDPAIVVQPRKTVLAQVSARESSVDGAFLYIPRPLDYAPKFSLRVRDTSTNAASLGTEVPVVRREDASGELTLIDVPTDPHYRATLRIYGWTAAPMLVGVAVFPENSDTAIDRFDVMLHGILTTNYVPFPPHPSYFAFDPLTAAVRASGGRVRIELTNYGQNVSPPLPPIWAFLSITNNETQQVTVVTPR
jgi:IPT/TIG domain-containing protein